MALMTFHASNTSRGRGNSALASGMYQARESGIHYQQRTGSIDVGHRKELNNETMTDALRQAFKDKGITLSDNASITMDKRRNWTVFDGEDRYTLREWNKREKYTNDKGEEKRRVVDKGIDIFKDRTHDYSNKDDLLKDERGRAVKWIETKEPVESEWVNDRVQLWKRVEQSETRRDARTSFKFMVALPRELTVEQNRDLIRDWVRTQFVNKGGSVADIAFHRIESSDSTPENPLYNDHAHIMVTPRALEQNKKTGEYQFSDVKNPLLDNWQNYKQRDENILTLRKSWADTQNNHLEQAGSDARVDHRSYNEQGIDKVAQIHMGEKAWNAEKNEYQTKRGDRNEGRKLLQSQQKEEKSGLWKRVTRNFSNYKPVAQKIDTSWSRFKQRSWDYKMKAVQWLQQVREQKPIEQQEKKLTHEKQVDRQEVSRQKIENRIRKEVAKNLRSHVERTQQRGEHHGIKR